MAIIAKPYTFSAGATIIASEHNSNFDTLYNDYNGNITNANLSASASIADSKLAQITTSGKVSYTSISGVINPVNGGVPVGTSIEWNSLTPPTGYVLEDGTAYSRTTYSVLFGVIGTTHGSGDGSTTFNVPDSRGKWTFSKAASGTGSTLGQTFGELDHDHTIAHTHTIPIEGYGGSDTATAGRLVVYTSAAGGQVLDGATTSPSSGASSSADSGTNNPISIVKVKCIFTGVA